MSTLRKWGSAFVLVLFVIGILGLLAALVSVGILPGEFIRGH